jgi:4-hydroxy-tetrahydrodipicolinate synthase
MASKADKLDRLREAARGLLVTSVTPFQPGSLALDEAGARRNLAFIDGKGIAAIIPAGNTGEFHSLTRDEMERLVRITADVAGKRQAVVVGVGGDLKTAIDMAHFAEGAGVAGVMIHEPSHTFASEAGIELYYRAIAGSIGIGATLYKRSARVPDRLLAKVTREVRNIVAIKYAVNDVAAYLDLVDAVADGVVCACGTAERWALPFAAGGTSGYTSGIANFAPEAAVAFWKMLRDTPLAPATRKRWHDFAAIEDVRARDGAALNVPVIKAAMGIMGLAAGPPRPPLAPLADALVEDVRRAIAPVTRAAAMAE